MSRRTHLTQQDEALRQSRLDDHARAVIHSIAQELNDIKPWQGLAAQIWADEPFAVAARLYGRGLYGEQVATAAQALMPNVDWQVTRGEYAQILFRAAGKATA
ncbi:hypothetical protein ABZ135_22145 [Streptomyces sp. NPDC006339]|uniref:hypothetical protein n=1 Tax=Streptomyces sp. NPDC006339 TaxID=3156755 RepID=UPI0033A55AA8